MAAIVVTCLIKDASKQPIESFIIYHLGICFSHVYLFYDEEEKNVDIPTLKFLQEIVTLFGTDRVTLTWRDEAAAGYSMCKRYEDLRLYVEAEVQARQTLNAELALLYAQQKGDTKWLLHIDIDEAFYYNGESVLNHFDELEDLGVDTMTYINHEAVPESLDCQDYFATTTLFRTHHFSLPINPAVEEAMSFWRRRTSHNQYFLAYDNGKSAVRVGVGALPRDVHRWRLQIEIEPGESIDMNMDIDMDIVKEGDSDSTDPSEGNIASSACTQGTSTNTTKQGQSCRKRARTRTRTKTRTRTALADPRHLNVEEVLPMNEPFIMHFVNCGISWLVDKYRILGRQVI